MAPLIDLYSADKSHDLIALQKTLINDLDSWADQKKWRNTQRMLIKYLNLLRYEEHRKGIGPLGIDIAALRNYANLLYSKYKPCLDSSDFCLNYPGQYFQSYLELMVAKLLDDSGFTLNIRKLEKGLPDLEVAYRGKKYFFECTTKNTNLMDRYSQSLRTFDLHFKIAKLLYEEFSNDFYSKPNLEDIPNCLRQEIKKLYQKLLEITGAKASLSELMCNWIRYIHHARCYFNPLVKEEYATKLDSIKFPKNIYPDLNKEELYYFLLKHISHAISDKLEKGYFFQYKTPIILYISLSLCKGAEQEFSLPWDEKNLKDFLEALQAKLPNILHTIIGNNENKQLALRKLYAVMIDLNENIWFPDEVYGGKKHRYFITVYNESIDSSQEMENDILSNLPYNNEILNLALMPTIF